MLKKVGLDLGERFPFYTIGEFREDCYKEKEAFKIPLWRFLWIKLVMFCFEKAQDYLDDFDKDHLRKGK